MERMLHCYAVSATLHACNFVVEKLPPVMACGLHQADLVQPKLQPEAPRQQRPMGCVGCTRLILFSQS